MNATLATVRVARLAMATRFEFVLHGLREESLRAAAEEALDEIGRLEDQLSLFRSHSDICRLNARAAREPVRVEPGLFRLLQLARHLWDKTHGAFDITVAPLMRLWGMHGDSRIKPSNQTVAEVLQHVGMQHVLLDAASMTVGFARAGLMLDLGSIGKGYALDQATVFLREAGVNHALLHGGTSSVVALGCDLGGAPWKVALPHPQGPDHPPLAVVELRDETISMSAVWGKTIEHDGRLLGHVMDPRTGWPAQGALMSSAVAPSAAESDALSTALLVSGEAGFEQIHKAFPSNRCVIHVPGKTLGL